MRVPSTLEFIEAWDRASPEAPAHRAVALLALASLGESADDLTELPLGERERRLLSLRAAAFGPRLTGLVDCEACGEPLELDIGVDDILATVSSPEPGELTIEVDGYHISLRLPDSRDMLAAASVPGPQAAGLLLRRCVTKAERSGAAVDAGDLPVAAVAVAGEAIGAADPLADLTFDLCCVACSHAWRAPFDTAQFLWGELDAWATRILREVHALAVAYGWAERDILTMSAVRRSRYLQLVEG